MIETKEGVKNIIDCDADPYVPADRREYIVEEHQKGGQFEWDPAQVELYLSDAQKDGRIEGNKLRKELEGKPVLNANVLDYLLKNSHLIPEEWKDKYVFFWGTIYRSQYDPDDSDLYVRFLNWVGDRWCYSTRRLDQTQPGTYLAALRKS